MNFLHALHARLAESNEVSHGALSVQAGDHVNPCAPAIQAAQHARSLIAVIAADFNS